MNLVHANSPCRDLDEGRALRRRPRRRTALLRAKTYVRPDTYVSYARGGSPRRAVSGSSLPAPRAAAPAEAPRAVYDAVSLRAAHGARRRRAPVGGRIQRA
ncbi:hypothetical protein EVAR_4960_1 [Eumeta japonica]|uniref:Uncharacterized protein n=1 Tax=Eumeta variegata TaxID=151549 RepID=A0A4C1V0Z6_EUMVA|nr:hypothetical protein EVAR_4960_1 [Eumeta japonica]